MYGVKELRNRYRYQKEGVKYYEKHWVCFLFRPHQLLGRWVVFLMLYGRGQIFTVSVELRYPVNPYDRVMIKYPQNVLEKKHLRPRKRFYH